MGGECTLGTTECDGNTLKACGADGTWIETPCPTGTTCGEEAGFNTCKLDAMPVGGDPAVGDPAAGDPAEGGDPATDGGATDGGATDGGATDGGDEGGRKAKGGKGKNR